MIISDQHKFELDFHPRSFEKDSARDIIGCDFEIRFDHIIRSFSEMYDAHMVGERMHDITEEEDYEDFYLALQELEYPNLVNLLPKYKSLFFPFMQEYFRIEFLEETFCGYPRDSKKYGFLLNSVQKMTLLDNSIRIEGSGFLIPPSAYSNFKRLTLEESLDAIKTI